MLDVHIIFFFFMLDPKRLLIGIKGFASWSASKQTHVVPPEGIGFDVFGENVASNFYLSDWRTALIWDWQNAVVRVHLSLIS